jgi:hypothetical protein
MMQGLVDRMLAYPGRISLHEAGNPHGHAAMLRREVVAGTVVARRPASADPAGVVCDAFWRDNLEALKESWDEQRDMSPSPGLFPTDAAIENRLRQLVKAATARGFPPSVEHCEDMLSGFVCPIVNNGRARLNREHAAFVAANMSELRERWALKGLGDDDDDDAPQAFFRDYLKDALTLGESPSLESYNLAIDDY